MKYLNKNFPNCKLNKMLRILYRDKQVINNSKLPEEEKKVKMKEIDREILRNLGLEPDRNKRRKNSIQKIFNV